MHEDVEHRRPRRLEPEHRLPRLLELHGGDARSAGRHLHRAHLDVPEGAGLRVRRRNQSLTRDRDVGHAQPVPARDGGAPGVGLLRGVPREAGGAGDGKADGPADEQEPGPVRLILAEEADHSHAREVRVRDLPRAELDWRRLLRQRRAAGERARPLVRPQVTLVGRRPGCDVHGRDVTSAPIRPQDYRPDVPTSCSSQGRCSAATLAAGD